jgi:MtrB/PioB family decaheme-associated outer membrane protein
MNASRKNLLPSRTLVALAVAAAWSTVQAQDIGELTAPGGSSVSVGVGVASGDERERARFGMFNGLRERDTNLLLGIRYEQPWSASGTGLKVEGRNLGLDNRDLSVVYRRIGEFKFNADYSEITRHDPRTVNTSMQGVGSTTPTVNPGGVLIAPGTGQNHDFELKRKGIGLGGEMWITRNLQAEVAFKNEEKDGERIFARGIQCTAGFPVCIQGGVTSTATGFLLLPEPVDSTIRQIDAKLNYANGPLVLSGGYYGSFYINHVGSIAPTVNVPVGGLGNLNGGQITPAQSGGLAAALRLPVALWPDNQAHTLSLAGNYALTRSTRVNFKYAYTRATQDESFSGMGLTTDSPPGRVTRDNLGGEINTTKAQIGFSAHPLAKLHVHGDLSYRHKQNKTPLDFYNQHAANNGTGTPTFVRVWTNGNMSPTTKDAKLEASYLLAPGYTGVLGFKVEDEDYGAWTPTEIPGGVRAVKQKLRENSWRAELRRVMSENLTGSVAYEQARRKGKSSWLQPQGLGTVPGIGTPAGLTHVGVTEVSDDVIFSRTAIFPVMYMDRERDKLRFIGNWTATEKLALQLFADRGIDRYHAPTEHGLRSFQMGNLALDATYAMSDAWKISAYASQGKQTIDSGHSTGYDLLLKDKATSFGVGVKGKPMGRLQVGADLSWLKDLLEYDLSVDPLASTATTATSPLTNAQQLALTGGLPDVTYKLTRLNLYGEYALQKSAYVRLDYIHHKTFFNEWMWSNNGIPFLYSDNTTVDFKQTQTVNFVGATYVYKFQ